MSVLQLSGGREGAVPDTGEPNGGQTAWVLIPVLLFSSWVTSGEFLNLSEPQVFLANESSYLGELWGGFHE